MPRTILICPICQEALIHEKKRYSCSNKHSFDIARQGYVNLLLANQKGSTQAGDSQEMMHNRHSFLTAGYYQPLADNIVQQISKQSDTIASRTILDVGCGEGYYIRYIKEQLPDSHCFAVDISKEAVKIAARQSKNIIFAVANSYHLPVQAESVDTLLVVFSPTDEAVLAQVCKPQGDLIIVTPHLGHLQELRDHIYDDIRPYDDRKHTQLEQYFDLIHQEHIQYQIKLDNSHAIHALLGMTPFYWRTSQEKRQELETLQELKTSVSFTVSRYQKR